MFMKHSYCPARRVATALVIALSALTCSISYSDTNAPTADVLSPPATPPGNAVEHSMSPEELVKQSVTALGADDWESRNAADMQLRKLSLEQDELVLRYLLETHVASDDPEVRHRAEEIMREVVIDQVFNTKKGYLGVRLSAQIEVIVVNNIQYFPIIVEEVMPNTAAQQANLLNGDKIIKIDDNLCTRNFGVLQMVGYISAKAPGTNVNLVLWTKGKEVARTITLRQRPQFPTDPPEKRQKIEFFERWLGEKLSETRSRLGLPQPAG
ncbi:MAG: PDZ domain-containing protein [Verrucomicrobia bacterium]|nr:PDZ domain-containing protein [Verrucomicrobiota bacterium]